MLNYIASTNFSIASLYEDGPLSWSKETTPTKKVGRMLCSSQAVDEHNKIFTKSFNEKSTCWWRSPSLQRMFDWVLDFSPLFIELFSRCHLLRLGALTINPVASHLFAKINTMLKVYQFLLTYVIRPFKFDCGCLEQITRTCLNCFSSLAFTLNLNTTSKNTILRLNRSSPQSSSKMLWVKKPCQQYP